LLAAPLIGKTVKINVVGELKSKSYVDITIDVMRTFGVSVAVEGQTYTIVGNQAYQSNGNVKVEGDWSNAAFPLAMGLLCGNVKILGLNPNSIQGDMAVLDVIKRLGGSVKMENNAYIAQKSHLFGCAFDVENIIDAAPVLAVLCCFAEGESIITGIERLRIKESDRLSAIIEMINAIGGSASLFEGKLIIHGNKYLQGGVVDCKNDHRIVMSAVVAGGCCDNVTILGSDAVKKSYPSFFEDYLAIGGAFDVI
jgi:3-phosphoshikimate 1-carboxyvinyltransferase